MKTKNKTIMYVISSIAFFDLFATATIKGILTAFIIGIIWGCFIPKNISKSKVINIVSIIIILVSSYQSICSFIQTWQPSGMVQSIADKINMDADKLLILIGLFLAVVSLLSLYVTIMNFCVYIIRIIKDINLNEVIKLILVSPKKIAKSFLKSILLVVISAAIGTALLTVVWSIPSEYVEDNIVKSAYLMNDEGTYPQISSLCTSQLDNFTDAIMLLEAGDNTDDTVIRRAMFSYRSTYTDTNPCISLIKKYVEGIETEKIAKYPRYWHGYLIFIKPLLMIMDYGGIRVLNGTIQLLLVLITVILFAKDSKLKNFILPYILSYLMLMPIALAKSLQFSSCFYVYTISSILLILLFRKEKYNSIIFLFSGICTAFFDFLTYPLSTFGMVIVIYLILREDLRIEKTISDIFKYGISWSLGYGTMWMSKWVIASLITGENVVANAADAFVGRTSSVSSDGTTRIMLLSLELKNIREFLNTPITILMIALVFYYVFKIWKSNKNSKMYTNMIRLPYILVALSPIVWYAFATNHSYIHCWFTNKLCVVSAFAIMCMLVHATLYANSKIDISNNKIVDDKE